jgi:hypothetical protein
MCLPGKHMRRGRDARESRPVLAGGRCQSTMRSSAKREDEERAPSQAQTRSSRPPTTTMMPPHTQHAHTPRTTHHAPHMHSNTHLTPPTPHTSHTSHILTHTHTYT